MYRVKALYDYTSPHADDLSFPAGQLITVTEEEDADWYVGEYTEESTGAKKEGLFPRNFVEKYEPEPPPRPNRASRHQPPEAPKTEHTPVPTISEAPVNTQESQTQEEDHRALNSPAQVSEEPPTLPQATKPAPETEAKPAIRQAAVAKAPPPVASKPTGNSFKDRIAAFNKPAAAPIAPFKPGGGVAPSFIKKPFVAPPPSRNAYVPPTARDPAPQKIYRREEDPEIAKRQAQDLEAAEKAGLAGNSADQEGEDIPKPTSLKERIALLQKQQLEQAKRNEASQKEKPKRPSKKRTDFENREVPGDDNTDLEKVASGERSTRASSDVPHGLPPRRPSQGPPVPGLPLPNRELLSDANDADQSAAGETTEDADGTSTSVEDEEDKPRRSPSIAKPPPSNDLPQEDQEADSADEEEEDDIDAETRRKMELRERMAKMSGGFGMPGMFGPPGGLPTGKPPPKKKTTAPASETASFQDTERSAPQRLPMIPVPGMAVRSPESEDTQLGVEKDETSKPALSSRSPEEVVDIEDVEPTSPHTGRSGPPPVPSQRPVSISERTQPTTVDRPVPPVPSDVRSPSPGSESDDEMPPDSVHTSPPPIPSSAQTQGPPAIPQSPPVPQRTSTMGSEVASTSSITEKRASRMPPPLPGSPPLSPPVGFVRPPPPPPPSVPATRHATSGNRSEEETEYEGDYDTDIAPGAKHKDALKSHVREPSLDDSTTADESSKSPHISAGLPPVLPTVRPPPPLPPQSQSSRQSVDAPRGVPPPIPSHMPAEDEDEYDPYRHPPPIPASTPKGTIPPPLPPPNVHPADEPDQDDSDHDDLYSGPGPRSNPPPRQSMDRPPPPPPHAPELPQAPPPPPAPATPQHEYHEPTYAPPPTRKSLDINRATVANIRRSADQPRPGDQGFVAADVDLGASSHWWTQPNMPPPAFQGRKDVVFEIEESTTSKRGGKTTIAKDVYVLFHDYSQTIISVQFDSHNVSEVTLEQRHEPPPPQLRQEQLEDAHSNYGQRIAEDVSSKQNNVVGDGTPHGLIVELLKPLQGVLQPIGNRAYGALVYANLGNASVQQFDEIRPGDIITFRNARFEGKHGAMHQKYKMDLGKEHVGVVAEWDGTKKKVRVYEQGRESKKCKVESFRVGDLRSGDVRVWRAMSRAWVGWESAK